MQRKRWDTVKDQTNNERTVKIALIHQKALTISCPPPLEMLQVTKALLKATYVTC